ncbi:hypothetical protein [Vibrio owensii]|uniref:hypothetical protein n=1 Tax=Vibrio owensii TaxID=696485 RepID=UPI0018F11BA1|nr:hypothetical protein [Vibrio owensii]
MLNDNYRNALNGLKAQGKTSHLFEGCEAETQHVYRIIMTENVPVNELDEAMLEKFISKEVSGKADYSKQVDRDGLQYVDLEKDVEIYPCVGDCYLEPILGQAHVLSSFDAKILIAQLKEMGRLSLITDTIQSLCERQDGTKLQTALPLLSDVKACISSGLELPPELVEKISLWETQNCSVINFDFEEIK